MLHGVSLAALPEGSTVQSESDAESIVASLRVALAKKLGRVIDLFREWDGDGSGEIDKREFKGALKAVGLDLTAIQCKILFDSLDDDRWACRDPSPYITLCFFRCLRASIDQVSHIYVQVGHARVYGAGQEAQAVRPPGPHGCA